MLPLTHCMYLYITCTCCPLNVRALPTPLLPCTHSPCASSPSILCEFRLWSACLQIVATGYEPQSALSVVPCCCQCSGLHTALLPMMLTTLCLHQVDALPSTGNANFLLLLASGFWCFAPAGNVDFCCHCAVSQCLDQPLHCKMHATATCLPSTLPCACQLACTCQV
jgi:hypothetical protein